jgi:threonine synthase
MNFIETRGNDGVKSVEVPFSYALLNPSASFGGLYVPKQLPELGDTFFKAHLDSSYKAMALAMLKAFEVDVDDAVLEEALALYDKFDDTTDPVPLSKVNDDLFVSELYHGPTRAFKDMALQPFGVVLSHLAQQRNEKYLILAATSGDTGPAALETFKNRPNIQVACLYPDGGTSDVQRLQMVTEDAKNLKVIGIKGAFDDAQTALKQLLASPAFNDELKKEGISLSAANSVNFGRIIFQIIYHIHSYLELVRRSEINYGEKIYLVVPSGNFGNALGGYYAKKMGLPIEKILISSNANNILTDFIQKGEYDLNGRSVALTTSPAMDILKSSNVERILFDMFGANRTKELMDALQEENGYKLTADELATLQTTFGATFSNNDEVASVVGEYFNNGYLMDPHTATCIKSYDGRENKSLKTVIYSTAEWTKFSPTIAQTIANDREGVSDEQALQDISERANLPIPAMINELFTKKIMHTTIIDKEDIEKEILKFV